MHQGQKECKNEPIQPDSRKKNVWKRGGKGEEKTRRVTLRVTAAELQFPLFLPPFPPRPRLSSGDHITRDFMGAWPPLPSKLAGWGPAGGVAAQSPSVCVHRGQDKRALEKELATSPAAKKNSKGVVDHFQ